MSLRSVATFLKSYLHPKATAPGARRFLLNERGSVAIYFGLSAIVFVGVAGLAVDAARGYLIKARLSEAIDAAALAGGKALQNDTDKNHTLVTNDVLAFFHANFPNGAMGANVSEPVIAIDTNATAVTVSSTAQIPTTLMRLLGYNDMLMRASAQVARAATGLDVVLSFDNSGSMGETISGDTKTKIQQQRQNAQDLVDLLAKPFTAGLQQQNITVQGNPYSLLNIGVVPWSAKVNVITYNTTTKSTPTGSGTPTPTKGASYATDPMGRYPTGTTAAAKAADLAAGYSGNVYKSVNSEVPLLLDPSKIPGGWTGCVYARYNGKDPAADVDLTLGATTAWPGWEPMAAYESDSRGGSDCYQASWNNNKNVSTSITIPKGWYKLPKAQRNADECSDCPANGILPLQPDTAAVKTMIGKLVADGNTDAAQGLFWAWEVLMPGVPYDDAVVMPPFPRAQAIVLMTDGQSVGGNGDAYHGWFGSGEAAASSSNFGSMKMPSFNADCSVGANTLVNNNLGNRLLALSVKIKGCDKDKGGPGFGPIKIYVIQYQQSGQADLTTLLSSVATTNTTPYFFQAKNGTDLQNAFTAIGASLSALRLVQ